VNSDACCRPHASIKFLIQQIDHHRAYVAAAKSTGRGATCLLKIPSIQIAAKAALIRPWSWSEWARVSQRFVGDDQRDPIGRLHQLHGHWSIGHWETHQRTTFGTLSCTASMDGCMKLCLGVELSAV